MTKFLYNQHICLTYAGECYLLGVSDNKQIVVEEYYDESFIAQHCLTFSGEIVDSRDENYGEVSIVPFKISDSWDVPNHPQDHPLNYIGLRFRGIRETDKVAEWVKPLPMLEKMPLLTALKWSISPMMVMGIAESRVLSETKWTQSETLVCRRVRLLIALPEIKIDDEGLPYDYETRSLHVIHSYHHETEECPPLHEALAMFSQLVNPTDCLIVTNHLIVADSGTKDTKSALHLYHLDEQNS